MRRTQKIILGTLTAALAYILTCAPALAAPDIGMNYAEGIGLPQFDIRTMVAGIIRSLLGLLGIWLVIIIMEGGFKLMTHGGNEEKRTEAIATIKNGIIGMILILMSSSIAGFVVNAVANAAGNYLG